MKGVRARGSANASASCIAAALTLVAASCAASWSDSLASRVDDAEPSTARSLESATRATLGKREETVLRPESVPVEPDAAHEVERTPLAARELRVLTLSESLGIAVRTNREHLTQREALQLTALSLVGTRHDFGPLPSAALSYAFADGSLLPTSQIAGLQAQLTQVLRSGGTLTATAGAGVFDTSADGTTTWSSGARISLLQPLLRGAGALVSHEALLQAERDLVYAVRDFELFREDFSIEVANRYYDLVEQKRGIENQRQNLESFTFGRQQAEALNRVGRVNALDVLRARRSELNARNALLGEEERHLLALDRFRIFLGLPDSVRVQVRSEAPEFVPVDFDVQSAVAVALANRLDLLNRREQLEDEERGLRIARNDLLPRLDFDASIGVGGIGTSINDQTYDDDYSAGFTFELPLDRVREKNDLRSARIGLTRARRSYDEFLDNVVVEIESAFRELERRVDSLEIQRQLIADQQANVRIAQIRFERGEVSNRDKVEAEQSLLEAKNGLIREQVDYEIARLRLLRSLGILFIDDNGMWRE